MGLKTKIISFYWAFLIFQEEDEEEKSAINLKNI